MLRKKEKKVKSKDGTAAGGRNMTGGEPAGRKQKYSRPGCLIWAIRRLWQIDKWFVFFMFVRVVPKVLLPLLEGYFPKELIDRLGAGAEFGEIAVLCGGFLLAIFLMIEIQDFISSRCEGRHYYPTCLYQGEMDARENYEMDYENTLKQDFKEIRGYAWRDACRGDCALEFFWKDLSDGIFHLTGIVTYGSLLTVLNPGLLAVVALASAASYFTARWRPAYYEKNKHRWEKTARKKDYLKGLSGNFSLAKDIKLYGLEDWLDRMMRDYQAQMGEQLRSSPSWMKWPSSPRIRKPMCRKYARTLPGSPFAYREETLPNSPSMPPMPSHRLTRQSSPAVVP